MGQGADNLTYAIGTRFQNTAVLISKKQYQEFVSALNGFSLVQDIELAYDVNITNYIEFETGLTTILVSNAVRHHRLEGTTTDIGRLLDNMLSSGRAFCDQSKRRLKAIGGRSLQQQFEDKFEKAKSASVGFRVMDLLRNHSQHAGSSVSAFTLSMKKREGPEARPGVFQTISVQVNRDEITGRPEVLRSIGEDLDALEGRGGRISLVPLVREYMAGLSQVLVETRAFVEPYEQEWGQRLDDAWKLIGDEPVEECIFISEREGILRNATLPLDSHPRHQLKALRDRNRSLAGLTRLQIRH